jgi:ferrous iron transport protein A
MCPVPYLGESAKSVDHSCIHASDCRQTHRGFAIERAPLTTYNRLLLRLSFITHADLCDGWSNQPRIIVSDLLPLIALRAGESAQVVQILGDSRCADHLREIGLRVGVVVEMIQEGSPCIVRLDGQKLCLRADELATVMVAVRDENA